MINVGIIGCGFVGGALKDWLEHNNTDCRPYINDDGAGGNYKVHELYHRGNRNHNELLGGDLEGFEEESS